MDHIDGSGLATEGSPDGFEIVEEFHDGRSADTAGSEAGGFDVSAPVVEVAEQCRQGVFGGCAVLDGGEPGGTEFSGDALDVGDDLIRRYVKAC